MKFSIYILFAFIIFYTYGCHGQEPISKNNTNKITVNSNDNLSKMVTEQLSEQIKTGVPDEHRLHKYGELDLLASNEVIYNTLKNNGYRFLPNEEFNKKVKEIFSRIIDPASSTSHIYLSLTNKCDRDSTYESTFLETNDYYIVKNQNFLTQLFPIPSILDYKNKYPENLKLEEVKILVKDEDQKKSIQMDHWKDLDKLEILRQKNLQSIIALNKYLFNDDKGQLAWLINNEEEFMWRLVKNYGYANDTALLKWYLDKYIIRKFEDITDRKKMLCPSIFNKNCDGTLFVNEPILNYINNKISEEDITFPNIIRSYCTDITQGEVGKEFSLEEKRKIIAYAANYIDPIMKKDETPFINISGGHGIQSILSYYFFHDTAAEKYYEQNNYLSLPNLKEMIVYSKTFDEPK